MLAYLFTIVWASTNLMGRIIEYRYLALSKIKKNNEQEKISKLFFIFFPKKLILLFFPLLCSTLENKTNKILISYSNFNINKIENLR